MHKHQRDELDHRACLLAQILLTVGNECTGGGWTDLEWGIRTGGDMMNKFYGADFFDHVSNTDGLEDIYSKAMWAIDHSGLCHNFLFSR